MKKLIAAAALFFTLLMQCITPTAGGSSDHGNAKMAGVIKSTDGRPAANVPVRLLPDNYNHLTSSQAEIRETFTDSNGHFCFDTLKKGSYCISGKDYWTGYSFVKRAVKLDSDTGKAEIGAVVMNKPGSIYIDADSVGLRKGMAVYLPGLPYSEEVDSSGIVKISDIPPGVIALSGFLAEEEKEIPLGDEYDSLEIVPGASLLLPSRSPKPFSVLPDSTVHSSLKGLTDTLYTFSAVLPSKPLDGNYIYRYSWGDGVISEWSVDPKQKYSWQKPGTYYVQSQVMRAGSYLAWSDPLEVNIVSSESGL